MLLKIDLTTSLNISLQSCNTWIISIVPGNNDATCSIQDSLNTSFQSCNACMIFVLCCAK